MATAAYTPPSVRFEIPRAHTARFAKDLRANVELALQHGDRHVVFDCKAWNQVDLMMLSSLIRCASTCRVHGASFEVANVSNEMKEHLRSLGLVDRLGLD